MLMDEINIYLEKFNGKTYGIYFIIAYFYYTVYTVHWNASIRNVLAYYDNTTFSFTNT